MGMTTDKDDRHFDAKREHELLLYLVDHLVDERVRLQGDSDLERPRESAENDELWTLFRALVNVRPPRKTDDRFLRAQDELLGGLIARSGISTPDDATPAPADPRMRLWRGDITTFAADAIVNAANSQMLGCWIPGHHCIDNAIHTFAGVQLRARCAELMAAQGHEEPTGRARLTEAYNLPCRHVIHTVGPIADGRPSRTDRKMLASCYASCLDAAREAGDTSIAFCCISTGVFGFPQADAARIAVGTTRRWLDEHDDARMIVVFDVFGETDELLYEELLGIG